MGILFVRVNLKRLMFMFGLILLSKPNNYLKFVELLLIYISVDKSNTLVYVFNDFSGSTLDFHLFTTFQGKVIYKCAAISLLINHCSRIKNSVVH